MSMRTELLDDGYISLGLIECAVCGKQIEHLESSSGSALIDPDTEMIHEC